MSHNKLNKLRILAAQQPRQESSVELNPEEPFSVFGFSNRADRGVRQDEEPFGMVMKAEGGEWSACEREIRHEGVRNIEGIGTPGTLREERLERADMDVQAIGRRCHHGE